jgi:hypothetical protein
VVIREAEQQEITLAGLGRRLPAAGHLNGQRPRLRRSRDRDAARMWRVPAFRQEGTVHQELELAALVGGQDLLAPSVVHGAAARLRTARTPLVERGCESPGVRDVDAEHDGRTIARQLDLELAGDRGVGEQARQAGPRIPVVALPGKRIVDDSW